jgi:hypothetical protein
VCLRGPADVPSRDCVEVVTEGILEAAARNGHSGAGIVRFILEHQQPGWSLRVRKRGWRS